MPRKRLFLLVQCKQADSIKTVKMEAVLSCETSLSTYQVTWCSNPKTVKAILNATRTYMCCRMYSNKFGSMPQELTCAAGCILTSLEFSLSSNSGALSTFIHLTTKVRRRQELHFT